MSEHEQRIDRMAELTRQLKEIKAELERHKVYFERKAEEDLSDSKIKTCDYSSHSGRVSVTKTSAVKVRSIAKLKLVLGKSYDDCVKEETKINIGTSEMKRVLAAIFNDDYIRMSPEDVLRSITQDPTEQKTLQKKLKGANFKRDCKAIMDIAGCDHKTASDAAYLYAEAIAYSTFCACIDIDFDNAVKQLKDGLIVDNGLKVEFTEF